jgi:hypothetical protein
MKILNLYACLGGNRYKWDEVAKEAGRTIFETALGIIKKKDIKQVSIFDYLD